MIRGSEAKGILLTNGTLGIWLLTDQGINGQDAFRLFANDVLVPIPQLVFQGELPLQKEESLTWTFDLKTGEFVAKRRRGNVGSDYRVVLHPTEPIVAVKWTTSDSEGAYGRVLSTSCGLPRLEIENNTAHSATTYRARSAIEGEADDLVVRLASNVGSSVLGVFLNGELTPLPETYDDVLAASKKAHEDIWTTDIEIDGPAEDQVAIRTMLYFLRRGATDKLPPFGASNAKYRGARFWDAEAWMLPVLAVVDYEKAKAATRWRIENLGEHIAWEAAVGGKDVTPKEFGKALHVAGWVAWWVNRATHLGLASKADGKKVLGVVFPQYYRSTSDDGKGMEIKGVESADEGRLRDNDLVTNLLAKRVAQWAADHGIADGEDLEWFNSIVIPTSADGTPATYDNDLLRGYQQTAALLAIYPLEEEFDPGVAERMFDRYADLTSEVGPAMSESIHATIASRLGIDDAYRRWRKSWQTYTDNAMMFHERRSKQDAYFMTGAAGSLQTVLYGFAGMHLEREGIAAGASKSLGNGHQVAFRPNLPAEWKSLTLHNISLGPHRATVRIDHSGVSIE